MNGDFTFTMIKPKAVSKGYIGPILNKIQEAGFGISSMKMIQLARPEAEKFYEVHSERPFYQSLVDFMISGPIVVAVVTKSNAVEDYRKLIGATDPSKSRRGNDQKNVCRICRGECCSRI